MSEEVRNYLSKIGRLGGRRSRRVLSPEQARQMVQVREARRAFREFFTLCFWSCDPNYRVGPDDVDWVREQLMKYGNRSCWERAAKLCR